MPTTDYRSQCDSPLMLPGTLEQMSRGEAAEKTRTHGVTVLDEAQLLALLGGEPPEPSSGDLFGAD